MVPMYEFRNVIGSKKCACAIHMHGGALSIEFALRIAAEDRQDSLAKTERVIHSKLHIVRIRIKREWNPAPFLMLSFARQSDKWGLIH